MASCGYLFLHLHLDLELFVVLIDLCFDVVWPEILFRLKTFGLFSLIAWVCFVKLFFWEILTSGLWLDWEIVEVHVLI